ncbi:hypothetical protein A9Y62_005642 [Escherichia coli]|nr:hypothetical protein [Escherichia coli]EFI8462968.1 hypothetical protein [Escherichia coli]
MVKPKNKHSLSHVRHDPAHCLAPGLFRALKRGERKRSKLDVTYDYGDGKRIEFIDRNLNPKKIKKTPKNGCLFNTACVP